MSMPQYPIFFDKLYAYTIKKSVAVIQTAQDNQKDLIPSFN